MPRERLRGKSHSKRNERILREHATWYIVAKERNCFRKLRCVRESLERPEAILLDRFPGRQQNLAAGDSFVERP